MPNSLKNSSGLGAVPIVVLVAAVGLLLFLLITNTFDFKNFLFNRLFPKPPSSAAQPESVPDEILFKFKPGASEEAKNNIKNQHALEVLETIPQIELLRVRVPAQARDAVIQALSNNPNVEYAEPNFLGESQLTPNDPNFPWQWGLNNTGQEICSGSVCYNGTPDADIDAPEAWNITQGAQSVKVAVIDTGVNPIVPELSGGKVLVGYNFFDNNTNASDPHGHGTAVTSILAANTNNNNGIAGVTWLNPILPIRDTDVSGSYSGDNQINSIIYAADQGAKVINLSQGSGTLPEHVCSSGLQDAVNYAWDSGAVVVASAGNNPAEGIRSPADCNNVIAVGATDQNDVRAIFPPPLVASAVGPQLDVVAPGIRVAAFWGDSISGCVGTSCSAPQVAGLAALIFSANPNLTNQQVVDIIKATADDKGPAGFDVEYGWGRINAYKALLAANGGTPPPAPTPTPITVTPGVQTIVISNISSTTSATGATIQWSTNIPSTSQVDYGLTTSLGSSTPLDSTLRTTHSVPISNLQPRKRYYFKVISTITGSQTSSSIQQLRTKNR